MADVVREKDRDEKRLSIRQALIDWSALVPVIVKLVEWVMQNV
ncbi:hypothetical protein [Streptomyces vinaceus]|nr:hypothetical protein [Streptomyces vinaceus]GHE73427.1 hypothetical protein GCM10017778_68300 [Streptomyces vinaceus]